MAMAMPMISRLKLIFALILNFEIDIENKTIAITMAMAMSVISGLKLIFVIDIEF